MSRLRLFLTGTLLIIASAAVAQQPKQQPPAGAEANAGKEKTVIFTLREDGDQQMTCFLSQDVVYTFELSLPEESKAQRIILKLYDADLNEMASSTTILKNGAKPSLKYASKKSGLYLLKAFPFAK
ncbi:MAG: hypothetical protein RMJ87_03395 [Cytophagales bacterium]|nr:hypothetical protein [Bernardetiaceae bacterium]MDW8204052.1 hypothetical protein [Cytophagales bacterium]